SDLVRKWVPIDKSNCVLDILKPQKSPISQVVVAILKNTNFLRAFTASSMIPAIYILQSIDYGPFELETTKDTLRTTPEGGVLLRPERPSTYDDLNDNDKKQFDVVVCATNIVLQGLPKDIYKLINHNIEAKAIWDNVKMLLAGSKLTKEDRESQLYDEFERFKMLPGEKKSMSTMIVVQNVQGRQNQNQRNFARGAGATGNKRAQNRAGNANAGQGKPIKCYNSQENGAVLDEEELLFLADECDAFDSDVKDESTAQSIFMTNLSSTGPANLQVGPSNASILSEKHVIDSNGADMGNSNVIPYEQYLIINEVSVEPSCASSVPNDDNNAYIRYV
ncbi:hypothetical protein Tco_1289216, partial [Tanacetum coccineum]